MKSAKRTTRPAGLGRYGSLVLAAWLLAGCGAQAGALLESYPYLAPGETDIESLRAHRAAAGDATAPEARDAGAVETKETPPGGLHEMIRYLLEHSPAVAASRQTYRAAIERVPQASTLPRPQLTYTYLPWPVETRVGPNEHRVQLAQAIPFPTKLSARHDAASALAEAAAAAHDRAVRDQITRLEELWADLYYYARAEELVKQNEELAKTLSQVAAERYANDRGQLFDVSKAQSQLAQLGYDRIKLEELHRTTLAAVNAVLGRGADAAIEDPAALPPLEVAVPEEKLLAIALEHQQELRELDARIVAADAKVKEAASAWLPDFSVGVQYMVNGPAGMAGVADSGQDALGVMVGVSLPIWFGDNAAKSDEADAALASTVLAKKAHVDGLEARLRELLFRERDARRLRTLYDEELLPQATAAMATAEQWYEADASRFTDFLEARGVYYSFALARERAAADHFKVVVHIEQLIGATLKPAEDSP